jgi:hypothetical protein
MAGQRTEHNSSPSARSLEVSLIRQVAMTLAAVRSEAIEDLRGAPNYANKRNDISYDEAGVRRLFELSDLHSVAAQLKNDPKISFFSNENDFLSVPRTLPGLKAYSENAPISLSAEATSVISPAKMCGKPFQKGTAGQASTVTPTFVGPYYSSFTPRWHV